MRKAGAVVKVGAIVTIFSILSVSFSDLGGTQGRAGKEESFVVDVECTESATRLFLFTHVMQTFPQGGAVDATLFAGEHVGFFFEALKNLYPATIAPVADTIIAFSGSHQTSLLFFKGGCVVGQDSLSPLDYLVIKAQVVSRIGQRVPGLVKY